MARNFSSRATPQPSSMETTAALTPFWKWWETTSGPRSQLVDPVARNSVVYRALPDLNDYLLRLELADILFDGFLLPSQNVDSWLQADCRAVLPVLQHVWVQSPSLVKFAVRDIFRQCQGVSVWQARKAPGPEVQGLGRRWSSGRRDPSLHRPRPLQHTSLSEARKGRHLQCNFSGLEIKGAAVHSWL